MTTSTQIVQSRNAFGAIIALLAFAGLVLAMPASAANTLKDISYSASPSGKVDITLEFAQEVGAVNAFSTDSPPRIAIDFLETSNSFEKRRLPIGSGSASAVSAVQAGDRTRVVVDLFQNSGYTTRSTGNILVLSIEPTAGSRPTAAQAMANPGDPTKRPADAIAISNIDFRRGDDGSGRVIIKFDNAGAIADMRTEQGKVMVDVANAKLPEELRRRLDVRDFATPVVGVEPSSNGAGTRLLIAAEGSFNSSAYQTGNEYVVEITPKYTQAQIDGPTRVGAAAAAEQQKGYNGKPVTFNFQDVPVRTVLQLIAEETNINVVASDTVVGNVTLRLINVPWDQALDIVLRSKALDKRRDGNVIWVAPQKEIADYEQAKEDARIAIENRAELVTEYIPINYGSASDIAELLTEKSKQGNAGGGGQAGGGEQGQVARGFLSNRGSVSFDTRTNTLLVIDIPKKLQEIREMVTLLDRPVDQVLIEARIVIANENFARDLGVRFGVTNWDLGNADQNDLVIGGSLGANDATANSFFGAISDPTQDFEVTHAPFVNMPVTNPAGAFAVSILRASHLLEYEFSALQEEQRGEVVANPRVITANQQKAEIIQGDEIGYVTVQAGQGVATQTVQFKEALLKLTVTPTITQDNRVFLNMQVKKDELAAFLQTSAGSIPQITRREVNTAVLVENGQTVVVGGVYEFESREDVSKVPFLGDIPFLGNLFKSKGRSNSKAELLILVTPRILQVAGTPRRN